MKLKLLQLYPCFKLRPLNDSRQKHDKWHWWQTDTEGVLCKGIENSLERKIRPRLHHFLFNFFCCCCQQVKHARHALLCMQSQIDTSTRSNILQNGQNTGSGKGHRRVDHYWKWHMRTVNMTYESNVTFKPTLHFISQSFKPFVCHAACLTHPQPKHPPVEESQT